MMNTNSRPSEGEEQRGGKSNPQTVTHGAMHKYIQSTVHS